MVLNMLKRLLILLTLVLALPGDGLSQGLTVREFYVGELRQDGYENIRISRTFLGRLRFSGSQPGRRREIIVNPANGAVLRDHVRLIQSELNEGGGSNKPPYPGGGGYDDDDDYDDDYDDDDYDDDDDDDDNSGSGSGDDDDD